MLNEGSGPDISVWVQSLKESINMMRPRSVKESRRVELMKHQLNEIRKSTNRLLQEVKVLQEENQLLQEKKVNEKKSNKEN